MESVDGSCVRVKDHMRHNAKLSECLDEESGSISHSHNASATGSMTSVSRRQAEVAQRSKETSTRFITLFAFLVLLVGCAASACFLYLGITSAKNDEQDHFDRRATEVVQELKSAWGDYEVAGLWIHESCRKRDFTRRDFTELYEYIRSDGLTFQAAEFIPNVTHAERAQVEQEDREFYSEFYPNRVTFHGFKGFEPDPEGGMSVQNRSQQEFYFPVRFVEPVEANAAAAGFDLYSSASRKASIHEALGTWEPSLTNRLQLVQETDPSAYSVLLFHPGVKLESADQVQGPRDLSLLVIRIPDLLIRSSRNQVESIGMYVYDKSTEPPQFLGATTVTVSKVTAVEADSGVPGETGHDEFVYQVERTIDFLPEVELDELIGSLEGATSTKFTREDIQASSKTWEVVVFPLDGTYEPDTGMVWMTGIIIALATGALAFCLFFNMRRVTAMNEVILRAEADQQIVSSLFPSKIRQQMEQTNGLQSGNNVSHEGVFEHAPIAELYPETTIMFCDVVGFTSWSSVRDPAQVFTLLESLYYNFDLIARRRNVFKVETSLLSLIRLVPTASSHQIGDCYVAVAGLPDPRKDHAMVMARFAVDCLLKTPEVTHGLETRLGPDTSELSMRCGLHSGPVTAGVLRGEKSRFQLFGDCVNVASRMESTGQSGRIQVSEATASLLREGGRGDWLEDETSVAMCKGKGELMTWWLKIDAIAGPQANRLHNNGNPLIHLPPTVKDSHNLDAKTLKLVEFNVMVLERFLRQIVVRQQANSRKKSRNSLSKAPSLKALTNGGLSGVKDVISMPEFDAVAIAKAEAMDPNALVLDPEVLPQLRDYTMRIAATYHTENPFHNFKHASHVVTSIVKLLSRIINPQLIELQKDKAVADTLTHAMHDHTFGITSDPVTQFAVVFAGLIHDVDHTGLPNAVLVKEERPLAKKYNNRSVAEANSLDIAWGILMEDKYESLRQCLFETDADLDHFRDVLTNTVMATDIMDKELALARKNRWEIAFSKENDSESDPSGSSEGGRDSVDRKATIVLEHLIQASDVAHTMQHWHIYRQWNQQLFLEMYHAYKTGHLEIDPSVAWYEGELGFFDYYIIPLAKKLETCGVFGVSSHEYRTYALSNRQEWAEKGKGLIAAYLKTYNEAVGKQATVGFQNQMWC
ncbi:Receptor-type guanylate cyclase gcy [Seminavis robusta]|uniref:Phosphodiesterase n=1 Tax=Seminavis robusta TaxID=568900 RepID=A0A9N8EDH3_9STRA|nr:Receptor-type guanylate cyclase gcy [Seminavis robusta]|eukprot:Sro784_g201970.1 Receptor-type guanylate cyclase gcy (1152) ;mRNA; f:6647-12084